VCGGAIMPGVVEVAQEIFGTTVKLHVPNQVGIRNPMFANVISLVEYVGTMSEVDVIAQRAVSGEELLRRKPVDFEPQPQVQPRVVYNNEPAVTANENMVPQPAPVQPVQRHEEPKTKLSERVRGIFGSMFD
ncbi:MAG: cell division protein FtsA C-terminal domain-containing protein, partial [Streptococcus equinus]|nr:cell division protein FtsA C-terminal domain-containing protein [Streptococcus equinus]